MEAQTSVWQGWACLPLARQWRDAGAASSEGEPTAVGLGVDDGPFTPGNTGKDSAFKGLLDPWAYFLWCLFPKSSRSSSRMFLDNFSGFILRTLLCILSVCPFTLILLFLSFLSHAVVLFIFLPCPNAFDHSQQTTQHNDFHIFKEYFRRGYLVVFFSVKFLLLKIGIKKQKKLVDFSLDIFSWCSFPSCSLVSTLHWWVRQTVTVLCTNFINLTFIWEICLSTFLPHRTYSL